MSTDAVRAALDAHDAEDAQAAVDNTAAVDRLNVQLQTAQDATLAAQQATTLVQAAFDAYKASHPDPTPPPPPPPPTGPVIGMNFPPTAQAFEDRADLARVYVNPGATDIHSEQEFVRAYGLGIRTFILSWKDVSKKTLPALFDSIPKDVKWYGVDHHEPEDDIADNAAGKGGFTLAQWRAWQTEAMPIVRAHGGIPVSVLMQWTLDPKSGRKPADYIMPKGTYDVAGFDFYPTSLSYQAAGIQRMKAFMAQAGLSRWLIGEYGVDKANTTLGVSLVKDFQQKTGDAEAKAYWSQAKAPLDYHFTQQTADAWFA